MHKLFLRHILDKDVLCKLLHWIMLCAMDLNQHFFNADIMDCSDTTVCILKMLVLDVVKERKGY